MNNEYDIRSIFEEMELELIRSMRRNLAKHQKWEEDEGINWTMWQAEQLKSFDKFKKENEKIFGKRFATVNAEIREFLEHTYETSGLDQEKEILNALANNKKIKEKTKKGLEGSFFNLNKKKMNALINATTNDLSKAEHAMLRLTNDQYRKIIYKAEVMFNSGAFTLKQAIDAASKDFLKAGINCVEYKDGRRVNIASYAEMCLRTSNKRAKFVAEGDVRKEYGIHTVKISKYGGCSNTCLPWQGRVYVDDVWSGGTKEEAEEKKLPLLSNAIEGGLFHPNCKHSMFTYYYDRKKAMGKLQEDGIEVTPEEQEHRRNRLHIQQQKRLEEGSLDPQNIAQAKQRKEEWIEKQTSVEQRQKIRKNYGNDLAQYERYKKVLGDEFISTFEDFRQLKYTDESKWEDLKNKYRTVNRYKVDYGDVKAGNILELDKVALNSKNSFTKSNFRKNGNVGVLQYDDKTKVAFSKINETTDEGYVKYIGNKEDVILLSDNRKYKTAGKGDIVDGKISKSPRKNDSEAKMFEYMRELHPNKNDKFEFTILSERNMCESCRNVKEQFQNEYKNAKINIVSGKKVVRHKKQQDGTVKEVEASPWDWRNR